MVGVGVGFLHALGVGLGLGLGLGFLRAHLDTDGGHHARGRGSNVEAHLQG